MIQTAPRLVPAARLADIIPATAGQVFNPPPRIAPRSIETIRAELRQEETELASAKTQLQGAEQAVVGRPMSEPNRIRAMQAQLKVNHYEGRVRTLRSQVQAVAA